MIYRLSRQQLIPASPDKVWDFFSAPENLDEITPPEMHFEILYGGGQKMYPGQIIEYNIQFLPVIKTHWMTEITHVQEPFLFVDEQRQGPYQFWQHQHHFQQVPGGTEMVDLLTYQLPFGPVGQLVHSLWVRSRLEMIFDYRFKRVNELFSKWDTNKKPL
jgi:ligand-binding SRPBCC domain-containing protein